MNLKGGKCDIANTFVYGELSYAMFAPFWRRRQRDNGDIHQIRIRGTEKKILTIFQAICESYSRKTVAHNLVRVHGKLYDHDLVEDSRAN